MTLVLAVIYWWGFLQVGVFLIVRSFHKALSYPHVTWFNVKWNVYDCRYGEVKIKKMQSRPIKNTDPVVELKK
jgi:hypothetical protein